MPTKIDGLVVLGASLFYKEKKVARLNGMQMIFAHQAWRLSRRLLIGLLMICGMFPSLVQAEIWHRTATSGMKDVAIAPNGLIWLTGKNGTIWSSPDDGVTFSQDEQASGIENIAAGRGGAWAVGFNGTLWRKLFSPQF